METSVDEGTRVEAGGDSEENESSENVNSSNINFHKENEDSIEGSISIDPSDVRLSGTSKNVEDTTKINSENLSQKDLGTELSTCGHDGIKNASDLGKAPSISEQHATVEDSSRSSPLSNSNSESSEREINLESLSPNTEESGPSIDASLSEPLQQSSVGGFDPEEPVLHAAPVGPSNDREDISEDELDIDSTGSIDQEVTQPQDVGTLGIQGPTNVEVSMELSESRVTDGTLPETQLINDDTRGTISSDDREIIDLKLEDAVGKSDDDDFNRESKGASEDLEAVSDDELPEASQVAPTLTEPNSSAIIGDVVSSEDEGALSLENVYGALHDTEHNSVLRISSNLDISEASDSYVSSTDLHRALDKEDSLSQQNSEPLNTNIPSLPPLEAEPISDDEDMEQADDNPSGLDGEGEAGEIKSPVRSPISEQGGLLGEVEPISADETSDTDGELPSGDDDSRPGESGLKSGNNFESIESDEDGDLEANSSNKHSSRSHSSGMLNVEGKKISSDYMENISDEENLEQGDGYRKSVLKSGKVSLRLSEENLQLSNSLNKDIESDKKPLATNFNEHQVELDYEENEGEEGVGKIEELPEPKTKDDGEEGELAEAAGSDKDEGELSDDDCEEGEIKEPGSKKPFVTPMCRFFQKGNCTWGINCRFLHPGVNDKGNYQMIEIPGFKPLGIRSRIGVPGPWPQQPEVPIELPPPPIPDIPPVETAWERGLRIAKEQRKKANERKELEPDFEEKCLNLSVDEERELNKENERMPKIIPKDPYYDQQAFEEDEYYKIPRDPWQTGHYENFEVRYHRENSFSPPYRDKTMMMPPSRYSRPYSPPVDKFGRERLERREPFRPEPPPAPITSHDYPSPIKRPDEWTDPWRRSKSPQAHKPKPRNHSRGRRAHRSVSDSSNSSRSSSGSSSGSSRSSHSFSGSSGSSSRSRSPEPAPPGVDRHDHYFSPSRDQPRSAVAVRGRGGYNNYDQNYRRGSRGYDRSRVGNSGYQQRGNYRGGGGGYYNNYGGGGGGYPERDVRDRGRDERLGRRGRSPPDRPLPYVRPRPKSASSRSSSSRSRSRSRGRFTSSHSRSSSGSSRSSSSSSSSAGSADSEHLYRDLGPPAKNPRGQPVAKKKRTNSHKEHTKNIPMPPQSGPMMGQPHSPKNLDRIPHPRDPKNMPPGPVPGRNESKYASRNAPQAPIKAKDPLKVVGQKSNIKLTLLPKQQQSSLGNRPNPLDSPPHNKRRLSERDTSPVPAPPAKRLNLPLPQASSALRLATEKASKLQMRQERGKSPPPVPVPQLPLPPNAPRTKAPISPQKQPSSSKSRIPEPTVAKAVPKAPSANAPTATATGAKAKKSMSSRREELLKQLKAVEDAIARKKSKLQ